MNMGDPETKGAHQELDLLGFLLIMSKRKRLVLGGSLAYGVLVVAVCLIMSPVFLATAQITPSQQNSSSAAQLLGQVGGMGGMLLQNMLPISSTGDFFVGALQTERILNAIIDRFDLRNRYGVETRQEARRILLEEVFTFLNNATSNIVSVSAQEKDPKLAADMANACVDELIKLLGELAFTDAGKRRVFFEAELKKVYERLGEAEDALQGFQETTGVVRLDEQSSVLVQAIASLKAQIAAKEIQLKVIRSYATENNPDLRKLTEEHRGLTEQLQRLLQSQQPETNNPIIPTEEIPSLGMEYIRKMRELRYNEALYEVLVKQFEAAKQDEAREAMMVQVINRANPPELRAKPQLGLLAIAGVAVGFCLFTALAFVVEYFEKTAGDPERSGRLSRLKQQVMHV